MKVAMVTPHYHPEVGGLETSVRLLAEWLAARGHAVTVHAASRATDGRVLPPRESFGGVDIRRYPYRLNLGYFRSVFRPDLADAELVHLHGYGVLTNDLVARRAQRPTAYSLHHGVSMPHPTPFTRFERSLYDRVLGTRTLRRVSGVIVANRLDLAWLEARGVRRERVVVLPSALPEDAFAPGDPARVRREYGEAEFVLYLGRLHAEKGVVDLVRALPQLPGLSVWFAGPDAGAASDIQDEARKLGVESRVRLLGYVPEQAKRDLLAACVCLVLPSLHEAQGIAVAEAWAQGRPVVASRAGAIPEWVEDGSNGLLVSPGDPEGIAAAVSRLEGDPARAAEMGQRGRARAESLRMECLGPEYEAFYEKLLSAPR